MLENRFSLLFYLKKPKAYTSGPISVYLRITVDGKPSEISTGFTCDPNRWNTQANRANGTKEESKALNAHLDILQIKVHESRSKALESNATITAALLKNILRGAEDKPRMLLEIFKDHNEKVHSLIGKDFTYTTYVRYTTSMEHTRNFIKWKYNLDDIDIKKLNYEFVSEYCYWLKSIKSCNHNTALKYISNFRKIVNIILPITTNSFDFTVALRNHFQIVGNSVYWSIKTDDTSSYKVFIYDIKTSKFDSILISHPEGSLRPPVNKDFAFSIYGNRICYLFNTNKNETWLYLYKRKSHGIYKIYKTKKLNGIYNFLKLTSNKIVLAACYRFHPLQRKDNTEIMILDEMGVEKDKVIPTIQYIESSLFLPFNMVDVSNNIIAWGNPDKYKFTLYHANDLKKQKEYSHSYSNWETIDTSIINHIRKNKYMHPRKVIDTLLKCCSHFSKVTDIGFVNDNTLLINYSIFDQQINKKKYFIDIWKYGIAGGIKSRRQLEECEIDTNVIFDNNSFPLRINNESYILGSNYLIIVKIDSRLSLIGNSYPKYKELTEMDMLKNDPVIKMVIYEYND